MLDSRLPARPLTVKVQLYPNVNNPIKETAILVSNLLDPAENQGFSDKTARESDFDLGLKSSLLDPAGIAVKEIDVHKGSITDYFEQILKFSKSFFANSATESLIAWLRAKFNYKLKIATPSFFCPHVAYSLYLEGHELLLYDISYKDLFISNIDIENLFNQIIDIFIIPSFFGYRSNIKQKLNLLKQRKNTYFIVDFAQAFPLEELNSIHDYQTAFLFSFGKSKALATAGGRVIIFPKGCDCDVNTQLNLEQSLSNLSENLIKEVSHKEVYESDIKILLQKKYNINVKNTPIKVSMIPKIISKQIDINYQRYLVSKDILKERYKLLKSIFLKANKIKLLAFCMHIDDTPIILALNIKYGLRYNFSTYLAKCGIESTWYYYPLHLQRIYKKKYYSNFSSTEMIASNILILPFSLNQSDKEINLLTKTLKKIL
ncbi:MAG: hypothetical protein ACE1S7_03030 [Candidatus Tisiphia sp.]